MYFMFTEYKRNVCVHFISSAFSFADNRFISAVTNKTNEVCKILWDSFGKYVYTRLEYTPVIADLIKSSERSTQAEVSYQSIT
jgi:hypothetical protein